MSRLLKKKAVPMICFESQECYPKAHPTSESFRFVVFRPFSIFFRPPKSNYLFQPLPHMSRLIKKKAIPMICFKSQESFPKAHLTSKSFRFVVFRPFSVFFRPPKSNYLFKPLPHMSRLLKKKPFQWYVLNLKNATQKPTWLQKVSDLWFWDLFRSFSDHLKATTCFNLCLTCLDCSKRKPFQWYVLNLKNATLKPTRPQKAFRFVVFRPFSVFFRPPKSNYTCFNLCLTCPNWSKRKPFQWYVLNLKNVTQKPTWPQKALDLWFSDLFRSFSDHLKATTCLNLCLTCLDCSERKPFQWYVLNFKNATQKPTCPQKAADLWFSDLFRSFSDHLKATTCFNLCLTCLDCSKRKPFQWYVLNLKNVTQKPTWPQRASDLWFSDLFRSFSDHLKATTCFNLCLTCLDCSKRKPFQWYVLNLKNATQKPTWPQKALDLWFSDLFRSFSDHLKATIPVSTFASHVQTDQKESHSNDMF